MYIYTQTCVYRQQQRQVDRSAYIINNLTSERRIFAVEQICDSCAYTCQFPPQLLFITMERRTDRAKKMLIVNMKITAGVSTAYKLSFFTRRPAQKTLVSFHDPFWILGMRELRCSLSLAFAMRWNFGEECALLVKKREENVIIF